jgi:hypothetical protein
VSVGFSHLQIIRHPHRTTAFEYESIGFKVNQITFRSSALTQRSNQSWRNQPGQDNFASTIFGANCFLGSALFLNFRGEVLPVASSAFFPTTPIHRGYGTQKTKKDKIFS